jgi:hypothetical protein
VPLMTISRIFGWFKKSAVERTIEISPIRCIDILEAMENATPMGQSEVAKKYEGLYVHWDGPFYMATDYGGPNGTELRVRVRASTLGFFTCWLDASKYPGLKGLERDSLLRVQGRIRHVHHGYVSLEDVTLYFPFDEIPAPPLTGAEK